MTKPKIRDGGLAVLVSPGCAPKTEGANKPAADVNEAIGAAGSALSKKRLAEVAARPPRAAVKKKPARPVTKKILDPGPGTGPKQKPPANEAKGSPTALVREACNEVLELTADLEFDREMTERKVAELRVAQDELNNLLDQAAEDLLNQPRPAKHKGKPKKLRGKTTG